MTMGNGNDTLFLCQRARKVYAFDISEEALVNTKKKLEGYDNYKLILDSHANSDKYIKEKCDLIIFNFGFLPNGKKYSVTEKHSSLIAVKNAYKQLRDNGYLVISFYIGHKGGKEEFYLIDEYIRQEKMFVLEKYRQDGVDSPITYIIKKSPR